MVAERRRFSGLVRRTECRTGVRVVDFLPAPLGKARQCVKWARDALVFLATNLAVQNHHQAALAGKRNKRIIVWHGTLDE
ncbi:hypothetical protein VI03_25585 [Burkholderia vietnamiensis]|nr:hypothetical protein VI03_25585 [Burkholderia vietnamiensis]